MWMCPCHMCSFLQSLVRSQTMEVDMPLKEDELVRECNCIKNETSSCDRDRDMATPRVSPVSSSGFSARLMMGKGVSTIPGSLGPRSPKKLHGMGKILEIEVQTIDQEEANPSHAHSKHSSPGFISPPSKTSNCKDTYSRWKSVQDCHASLTVANPRHFEFAVANLCFLLKAYGKELDSYVKFDIDKIFQTIRVLVLDPSKRPSTRMQLLKVIELRARRWDAGQATEQTTGQHTENKVLGGIQESMKPESQSFSKMDTRRPVSKMDTRQPVSKTDGKERAPSPTVAKTIVTSTPPGPSGNNVTPKSSTTAVSPDTNKQPSPKSTGFWDALTTMPEFHPHLPPIPEETSSEGLPHHPVGVDSGQGRSPGLSYSSMSPIEREKRDVLKLPMMGRLPEEECMFEDATTTLAGDSSPRTAAGPVDASPVDASPVDASPVDASPVDASPVDASPVDPSPVDASPVDPSLGNGGRTRRLSGGSTCSSIHPIQYSREFLLKCWDSPLCRVMPPALQHTIPHSDIYYIIRIPTFEDPTFLLKDDSSPSNIKSTVWDLNPNQSTRRRYSSWPNSKHSVALTGDMSGPV